MCRRRWSRRWTTSPRSTTRSAATRRFWAEFDGAARGFVGRPSPLTAAPRLGERGRRAGAAQAGGPEPHRRAQDQQHASARRCSPAAWASGGSSPRPAPGSTAWRPRRCAPASDSSAWCTWAPRTSSGRRSTCTGCSCWGHRGAGRVGHADAQGRDQRGAARLGHQRARPRTTSSARWSGPIRIPAWCATSSRSSAARRGSRCWSATAGCRTRWWPASAAAPTPWGFSPAFSTTRRASWSGSRRPGEGIASGPPQRDAQRRARPACCTAA